VPRHSSQRSHVDRSVASPREFEILEFIEKGLCSVEIAEKLFISVNTVDTHRKNILAKTDKVHISDLIYELKDDGLL